MDESVRQYYDLINQQQQQNNAWSAEQAQKAMDYQTQMSNTAHQREVADLKAAGLNPVLSAGTQGATTGTGHAAQAGNENVTALYGLLSKVFDAQLVQAEAMKTSAKAVSGATGSYKPFDSNNPDQSVEDVVTEFNNSGMPGIVSLNGFIEFLGNLGFPVELIDAIAKKVLHLSKSDLETVKKYLGDEPLHDLIGKPSDNNKNNRNGGWKSSAYERLYAYRQHLYEGDDGVLNKKPGELDPRRTGEKNSYPPPYSKKQKQEAAVAVGLALAAMIGKGFSGGSTKRIKSLVEDTISKA